MAFGSCNPSGRWDEVLVHESEDAFTDLLEFSFNFRDVFLRVRRLLLVVLLSLCFVQFVPLFQQPQLQTELPSEP